MKVLRKLGFAVVMTLGTVMTILLLFGTPAWVLLACLALLAAWMTVTRVGQQTWSVARTGIATLPQRFGSSAVVIIGIAGVVGVLVALLAMGTGFETMLKQTGTDDTAIVVQAGAQSEGGSLIKHDAAAVILQAQQVLRNPEGKPIASPEVSTVASLPKKGGLSGNVAIRGVGEQAWEVRPQVRITAGRTFASGLHELMVGRGVHEQFADLGIGSTLTLNSQSWTVVGHFDSGDAHNSEIWGDAQVIGSAFRRGSDKTSLTVRLTDASAMDAFKAALASDSRLEVDVQTTREFYSRQSAGLLRMVRILGLAVGAIMAIGAIFGALNSMYSAVAARARETATLRAIGFRRVPVVVAVLLETMLLAVLGGGIGAAIAWLAFDGFTASTLAAGGQMMFEFKVSPALLWNGLKWALAIGFIGGAFPAVHAARVPIVSGLREL